MGRPYAEVIGDPIAHSKSPLIHNFWLGKLGIDAEYRPCHVRPGELRDYFARRLGDGQWRGCNVTMPHKQAVVPLMAERDAQATAIGAVNTVVPRGELHGSNTDAAGFAEPLPDVLGDAAIIVGAGGAARAVLLALDRAGIEWFTMINRDQDKARALLKEFGLTGDTWPLGDEPPPAQVLVNASSLGMAGQPPFPNILHRIAEGGIVYDIVTQPVETPLIRQARQKHLRTIDGLAMLIGQAAIAFEKFFGQPAPREHDAELRALLTR